MRASALCLLISATFTRLFNAFQFNRSSWAVPELYELIQGVPLGERGWKNSPVPTAGTNPSARPPHQSKVLGGERERAGKGKPFFRRVPSPLPKTLLSPSQGFWLVGRRRGRSSVVRPS